MLYPAELTAHGPRRNFCRALFQRRGVATILSTKIMSRVLILSLLLAFACTDPPAVVVTTAPEGLRVPEVRAGTDALLFTFVDDRRVRAVSTIAEVPEEKRARVLVTDLRMSASDRRAHKYNYFVDLTTPQADGSYAVSVVSRFDPAKGEGLKVGLSSAPEGSIVLYTAEWCGFCKKAKAWMQQNGVEFVERDVDKQPGAQAELQDKLKAAGVSAGGIPVIDWQGELTVGFNKARLKTLLKERPPKG